MTVTRRVPVIAVRWRAHDAAGVGHALPRTVGYSRYLCNRMPIAERFAWPVKTRCGECEAELARLEEAPTTKAG